MEKKIVDDVKDIGVRHKESFFINGIPYLTVNVFITMRDGKPFLKLVREVYKPESMKHIIDYALDGKSSILCYPVFNDKIRAFNTMLNTGIIQKNDKGEYEYKI